MKHARIRSKEDALLWLWGPDADNPVMPEEGYSPSLVHAVLPYLTEPLEWLHIARGTGVVLPPDYEKVLATNGEWAFSYAQEVLQGPFPEAHAILATDLDEGLVYAQHILESRWPEFEATLFQMDDDGRPTYLPQALTYALHFGCRLPEPMHSHLEEHIRVFRLSVHESNV